MRLHLEKEEHEVTVKRGNTSAKFMVLPLDVLEHEKLINKHSPKEKRNGVKTSGTWGQMGIDKALAVIKSWTLEDKNGRPLECNAENKKTAFILYPSIIGEVLEQAAEIGEGIALDEEDDVKNSEPGLSGSISPEE